MKTMTGERGPLIQQSDSSPWKRTLNGSDEVSITMTKKDLKVTDPSWWTPLKGGLLVTLEIDGVDNPFMATLFEDDPEEDQETVTFTGSGINAMLDRRVVLNDDYFGSATSPSAATMKTIAKSTVSRKGMSLGTIMQEIVQVSIDKLGGQLPIKYGTPREAAAGLNERNYKGYNLSNIGTLKLLTELSNVINGPDFMFRPEWADSSHNFVVWVLYNGTAKQPSIHQTWSMDIDTTSPRGGVTDVQVKASRADYANRVYWTGAGEDAGTLIRGYQDTRQLSQGMPLVEYVGSTSDSENPALISKHAESYIKNNQYPLTQVTATLDTSDPRYRLDRWHVGDTAEVTVKGWLNIPDGTHTLRIISASGSVGSPIVSVEFAQEVNDGTEIQPQ